MVKIDGVQKDQFTQGHISLARGWNTIIYSRHAPSQLKLTSFIDVATSPVKLYGGKF